MIIFAILLSSCENSNASAEPSPEPSVVPVSPTPTPIFYESGVGKVLLSEIMSKNKATISDADGDFPDWIELENITENDINLFGWSLTDGKNEWTFPDFTLYQKSRAIIFASKKDRTDSELHASFSLSEGDTVNLFDRNNDLVDSCTISKDTSDVSLIRDNNNNWVSCEFPSPGYENTRYGYDLFCSQRIAAGPLVINEVCVDNFSDYKSDTIGYADWVELKNISDESIELSGYYISDDIGFLKSYQLSGSLGAGEVLSVLCDKDASSYKGNMHIAPFSLNSENDRIYLSDSSGQIIDYTSLKLIPLNKTYGRIEGQNGFFYLTEPTPGTPNSSGIRFLPEKPVLSGHDGIFNGVSSVIVELNATGDIYYTLDASKPSADSLKYTGPIELLETSVIRAINVESGGISSEELVLSYIINENHDLPVASLVCGSSDFDRIYQYGQKDIEVPASISFYEDSGSFTSGCGVKMNGASSLVLNKKNLSLRFRGSYGAEQLNYDLFGGGITSFTNLVLRAGQDQNNTIIRNEACYQIAREFSDNVLTLRFKYCVLYIDGKYNGIYAFIEKPNEAYAASAMGVSKDSVEVLEASVYSNATMYADVMQFAYENDMRVEENYRELCKHLDIDSLIDWSLIQGFLGNYDLASGNLRYAHSTENDGKWRLMLYDLDCAFSGVDFIMNTVIAFDSQVSNLNRMLLKSPIYREKFLSRASEAFSSVLTQDNMISIIDELCTVVYPEVERDKQFSGMSTETWQAHVESLKSLLTENNWDEHAVNNLCHLLDVSPEERTKYFGDK
ncbi:MAG: CotH kinase family protein [Eubacteriales bacterium]|nr:CotH kinase family protein [Eubacteriales bacterium]